MSSCTVCGNTLSPDARFCNECGASVDKAPISANKAKYPALTLIVGVLKVAGAVAIVLGIVSSIALYLTSPNVVVILIAFGGAVSGVLLWGVAEMMSVVVDIEANTRARR